MPTSDVPLSSELPPAKVGLPTLREQQTQGDLRRLLEKPLGDIRRAIDADNPHIRGLALEALAVRLMRHVDLIYVTTRLRGTDTGGTDVDVIFESTHLVFSRWQIRCKRTDCMSLDDVATEVGIAQFLKTNAVVMVSTGRISDGARHYANQVMNGSNLCIVMVDGDDLARIETSATSIRDVFTREAGHAMHLKKLDP